MRRIFYYISAVVAGSLLLGACSTTARIPSDEVLYTGVKKVDIVADSGYRVHPGVTEAIKEAVDVAPNN